MFNILTMPRGVKRIRYFKFILIKIIKCPNLREILVQCTKLGCYVQLGGSPTGLFTKDVTSTPAVQLLFSLILTLHFLNEVIMFL